MECEFGAPGRVVDRDYLLELLAAEIQPAPVDIFIVRRHAERVFFTLRLAFDTSDHPAQHAHVLAETRPDELAVRALAEPVDAEDLRQFRVQFLETLAGF